MKKLITPLAVLLTVVTMYLFSNVNSYKEIQTNYFFFGLLLFSLVVIYGYFFPMLFDTPKKSSPKKSGNPKNDFIVDLDERGGIRR